MKFLKQAKDDKWMIVRYWLSAPFIYSMIVPVFILDVWAEIYHRICFPLYGMELVERGKYIKIDRQRLKYLNGLEKLDCMYCGYANGVIHYVSVIVGETERYWCGIEHNQEEGFKNPKHHKDFLPYGDRAAFKDFLQK
jgi:hypothetical protein